MMVEGKRKTWREGGSKEGKEGKGEGGKEGRREGREGGLMWALIYQNHVTTVMY